MNNINKKLTAMPLTTRLSVGVKKNIANPKAWLSSPIKIIKIVKIYCQSMKNAVNKKPKSIKYTLLNKLKLLTLKTKLVHILLDIVLKQDSINFNFKIPKKQPLTFQPVKNRICYVLYNSLPYASGGYATRAHGLAKGLMKQGFDVHVLTRPGFPYDLSKQADQQINDVDEIDGVRYHRIARPLRRSIKPFAYVESSAYVLENELHKIKPALVIAASSYQCALPAHIAAKRLGLPFIYEVRGFWELTRASREPEFLQTKAFKTMRDMEIKTAKPAEHVFTLADTMSKELVRRKISKDKTSILPNSVDIEQFVPQSRNKALADTLSIPADVPVIGYVGTFVDYEGLEDLTRACALLFKRGIKFRLLFVGGENAISSKTGSITDAIAVIANKAGFGDWVIMPGRVPPNEIPNYYSLIDVAPFPRKAWPVCELVTPMKPFEAMAMQKAVIVSSVKALQEMVVHNETGLVFKKNSIKSLADALEQIITDAALRKRLGAAGRAFVEAERTWNITAAKAVAIINRIIEKEG